MKFKLWLASAFTLGLLASFLFTVVVSAMLLTGIIELPLAVAFVVLINFVIWLVSPKISDFIYTYFYDMDWVELEDLREISPESAEVIERVTAQYSYSKPKLGILHDDNPNAFTYGSGRWNSRIIVSKGLFKYCDSEESAAVYAHELGHITNRDFIVMTVANTLVQLLYIAAVRLYRQGINSRDRVAQAFIGLAIIAFVFYYLGQYLLLYLSRVREYYADSFAAEHTNPDHLSSALIKVAYGIMAEPDDKELVKATESIGLTDFEMAEKDGVAYHNSENLNDFTPLVKAFLYDLKNPWAFITELKSTHPLTGKRIRALSSLSEDPMFDFERIEKEHPVDKKRLYSNFVKDFSVAELPKAALIITVLALGGLSLSGLNISGLAIASTAIMALGIGMCFKSLYRYPSGDTEQKTVLELLGDVYASPMRGKNVKLDGELIGKGQAGYKFSKDVMFKDETGLMFIQYQSKIPVIGNLLFAVRNVPELVGQKVNLNGWFFRGVSTHIGLRKMEAETDEITSYVRFRSLLPGIIVTIVGLIGLLVLAI